MERLSAAGVRIPKLGLGTFRMVGKGCQQAVEHALALGYRHFDTAEMYGNEDAVGAAIAASGQRREEIHVTTKVWYDHLTGAGIERALAQSLARLRLDYVDLYLVHWPTPSMDLGAVFEALIQLRDRGLTRAIGVANFTVALVRAVVEEIGAPIACNQIEYHALLDQTRVRRYLASKSIPLVAYCPLAQGKLAQREELRRIAAKHQASPAQVALQWLLHQEGVGAIPKASRHESQQANLEALALELDDEDRRVIATLPKDIRLVDPAFAPRWDPPEA